MMMMMMITTTIKFSKEKIQIAVVRCLNCCFMEESNLALFSSSGNKVTRSQISVLAIRKASWIVKAPFTGKELPVAGGMPRMPLPERISAKRLSELDQVLCKIFKLLQLSESNLQGKRLWKR